MGRERPPERGINIANIIVWGAITLMMAGAAAFSATASFNSAARHDFKSAVATAGLVLISAAIGTASGYVARHAAHEAFPKPSKAKQELPPYFTDLFGKGKGDSPNPPPPP